MTAIETHALTKRFGSTTAVDQLSLAVERGRITGFLGRNGAGKSTTIKMLLGMFAPTSGTAKLLGHDITDPRASVESRRRVAYVGEDKGVYPYMTVAELIRFTRSFYDDWHPAYEARLLELYELPLHRTIKALSKGMRTKVALLLALARRPELLILDEPSEGLDPVAIEQLLQDLVGRSADGTTIFFSSHRLEEVERIADDVVMIARGKLVLDSSLDDLRAHYRSVVAGFTAAPDRAAFLMPGVHGAKVSGRQVAVEVTSNVDAVVRRARELGATSVDVSPVSLREVFLDRVS